MPSSPFARILVGYVASEQGADAQALGAELATASGGDVTLVNVVSAFWIEHVGEQTGPALIHSGQRERAASALKEAADELAAVLQTGHVERRLEASSSPARGLHDTAVTERADLIVVGSTHHGALGRVLLGSVGERLLAGAPCAVAVAPRGYAARQPRPIRVIAVAFDGSPEAQVALATGHALATRIGAALRVIMVIEPPAAIPGQFVPRPGLQPVATVERAEAIERQEAGARTALDRAIRALGDGCAMERQLLFRSDPPAAILDAVRPDVDLLVLGSRAYGPIRRALAGGVSHAVIRHAPCPVLITPRVGELAG